MYATLASGNRQGQHARGNHKFQTPNDFHNNPTSSDIFCKQAPQCLERHKRVVNWKNTSDAIILKHLKETDVSGCNWPGFIIALGAEMIFQHEDTKTRRRLPSSAPLFLRSFVLNYFFHKTYPGVPFE
jgi:hypothetical protein